MTAIESPTEKQCKKLEKSGNKYVKALEKMQNGKDPEAKLEGAEHKAEIAGDEELAGWLDSLEEAIENCAGDDVLIPIAREIAIRYNEYNAICGWGFVDFNPEDPLGLPGSGGDIS